MYFWILKRDEIALVNFAVKAFMYTNNNKDEWMDEQRKRQKRSMDWEDGSINVECQIDNVCT